jgi:hypothetical protein
VLEHLLEAEALRARASPGCRSARGTSGSPARSSQRRVLEEVRHHQLRVGVLLQLEDDAHLGRRLVAHVDERRQLLPMMTSAIFSTMCLALDAVGIDVTMMLTPLLGVSSTSTRRAGDRALAGLVDGLELALRGWSSAAGREIGALDLGEQRFVVSSRSSISATQRVDHLAEVVRRDARRHADGDALRAVDEQVREARRQDDRARSACRRSWGGSRRCFARARPAAPAMRASAPRCSAWRRAHRRRASRSCRGRRPAARAGEVLRQADHRVVDRGVAVRVVLAHHVADDAALFLCFASGERRSSCCIA